MKRGDIIESRLPHERKPTIVSNSTIGIFGEAVRKRSVVHLRAQDAACNGNYDKVIDSFQKSCHIIYALFYQIKMKFLAS